MTTRSPRTARVWWTVAASLLITSVAVISVGTASAQDDPAAAATAPAITVGRVDATGDDVVVDGWLTGASVSDIRATVDGKKVTPTSATLNSDGGGTTDVVVVLDNAAALGNAAVQLAKKAVAPLYPGAGVVDTLGLITTGGAAKIDAGQTSNPAEIEAAMGNVRPTGASATWDGLSRAAELLEDRGPNSHGTVVLFTASTPALSGSASSAESALRLANVDLQVVALPAGTDLGGVQGIVNDVGGTITVVNADTEIAGGFQRVADTLDGAFTLTLPTASGDQQIEPLTLTAGKATTSLAYVPGALRVGATALAPVVETSAGLFGFLSNPIMIWIIVLLGVSAAVMLVWALLAIFMPDDNNLVRRLEVYEDPYGEKLLDDFDDVDEGHTTVPIIKRAVEFTGDMADKRGLTDKLEVKLEKANLPLRAAEAIFFLAVLAVVLTLVVLALTRNPLMGLIAFALTLVLPSALLNLRIRRRQKAFVNQLPDMLTLLAGTLRAGYSIGQGFESVSTEIAEPMGRELRRVVTESRLGRSLEEALEAVAERMDSDDFGWAVMAIKIQREVGGNLAELLLTVADTMTQRERLRRDVSTLTAEGRMSAIIIGLLPPGLCAVMFVMNPAYIKELFTPGIGYMLVGVALVMMAIGGVWMKKTVTIEV